MHSSYGVETAMETDISIQTNPFLQQKVGQLSLMETVQVEPEPAEPTATELSVEQAA